MKKIYMLLVFISFMFLLSGCDNEIIDEIITIPEIDEPVIDDNPEDPVNEDTSDETKEEDPTEEEIVFNAGEMVQVLSSGRNNFMPRMDQIESDLESGDFMDTEDFTFYEVGCQYGNEYIDNGDGTYTQTFYYYDYDYDYYYMAEEVLYNGVDDDDDGEIDEDDEILTMVTDEMSDGLDNNQNGVIDEYFEMTPSHFVTYTMTYGETQTTYTNDDGVSTTTGSYSYEWREVREPYNGQIIEVTECQYQDDYVDPNDDEYVDPYDDTYNDLLDVYDALLYEVESVVGGLDDIENQVLYFEFRLGRTLTEEEYNAFEIVLNLYDFDDSFEPENAVEANIQFLELYLDRALSQEELDALRVTFDFEQDATQSYTDEIEAAYEIIDALYMTAYEQYQIVMFEAMLGRVLTLEELEAIEIAYSLDFSVINPDDLTDEQIAAITIVENLTIEAENSENQELLFIMMFLGRPLTEDELNALMVVNDLMVVAENNDALLIEDIVLFYENILGRVLTEKEIEALELFE